MREFKGRLMKCKCCPRGKVRHEPDFADGETCHILTSICINCGNPKITKNTTVWTGLLADLENESRMLFGRERAKALREFRNN